MRRNVSVLFFLAIANCSCAKHEVRKSFAQLSEISEKHSPATVPPLPTPRISPGVAALDGLLYVVGGRIGEDAVATVESYDPKTDRWVRRAPMPLPRFGPAVCTGDGLLFVIGGSDKENYYKRDVQAYDPRENRWSLRAPMPWRQYGFVCGTYKGRLHLIGGHDMGPWSERTRILDLSVPFVQHNEPHVYDIDKNSWSGWDAPPHLRIGSLRSAGALVDGTLYLLTNVKGGLDVLQEYDMESHRLSSVDFSEDVFRHTSSAIIRKKLFIVGGPDYVYPGQENRDLSVHSYSVRSHRRIAERPLRIPRRNHGVAVIDGAIYVVGGRVLGSLAGEVEVYRPWEDSEPIDLPPARIKPNDFAVVVGIENYRALPPAKYALRDAESIREMLTIEMGVPEQNIITLLDEKAGAADIAKFIDEWLPRNITEDSRLYFYFSGHGTVDPVDGTPFLMPWDGDLSFLRGSSYSLGGLIGKLQAVKTKDTVVLLEACFSAKGNRCVQPRGIRPLVNESKPTGGRFLNSQIIIAASAGENAAVDDSQGHGVFTANAIRGARTQRGSGDGKVLLNDWLKSIQSGVAESSRRMRIKQTPRLIAAPEDALLNP